MINFSKHILISTFILVILCFTLSTRSYPQNSGFVGRNGADFILEDETFYFLGTNCYYLMVYAADAGLRTYVDEVLEESKAMGLKVVRTWAFNDGESQWNSLQTSPGIYQEQIFQGLDYVLTKADELSLRLILPFVNNWDDYGGMNQYVQWSPTAQNHDNFYTDENTKQWYKNHIHKILNRVNTINGRIYKQDPTIFAWELANEPRCNSDPAGAILQVWLEEMSIYVKSLDQNHMVTTGIEGFYNSGNPIGWMDNQGTDFIANHQINTIDFIVAHSWPDHWGWKSNYENTMDLVHRQITDAHNTIGKPFVLEEFGKKRPLSKRDQFYQGYFNLIQNQHAGGSLFWILYHDDYQDYDGFGVYYHADSSTINIIKTTAALYSYKSEFFNSR